MNKEIKYVIRWKTIGTPFQNAMFATKADEWRYTCDSVCSWTSTCNINSALTFDTREKAEKALQYAKDAYVWYDEPKPGSHEIVAVVPKYEKKLVGLKIVENLS